MSKTEEKGRKRRKANDRNYRCGTWKFSDRDHERSKPHCRKSEHIKAVDFVKGMSSQELKQKLEEQMEALGTSEILVMTDLLGGTPFNVASGIKTESEKSIKVLAGTNLAMAVEAIFCRELMGLEELAEIIRQSAKDGVEDFDSLGNDDEMIFEDGV